MDRALVSERGRQEDEDWWQHPTPYQQHPTRRFRVVDRLRITIDKTQYQQACVLLATSGIRVYNYFPQTNSILIDECEIRKVLGPIPFIVP